MDYDFYLLGHERYMNSLFVEGGGHLGCLGHVSAVHQPEPGADGGGEVDAVVDEGEGGAARDVLPLGSRRSACNTIIIISLLSSLTGP